MAKSTSKKKSIKENTPAEKPTSLPASEAKVSRPEKDPPAGRILIPGGLDKTQMTFPLGISTDPVIGFLVLMFSLLWRAQLASFAATAGLEKKYIQGLPSMRFIDSDLLTKNDLVHSILASLGIFRLSLFFAKDY